MCMLSCWELLSWIGYVLQIYIYRCWQRMIIALTVLPSIFTTTNIQYKNMSTVFSWLATPEIIHISAKNQHSTFHCVFIIWAFFELNLQNKYIFHRNEPIPHIHNISKYNSTKFSGAKRFKMLAFKKKK